MEADLLQKQTETGKLVIKDGWVICPVCGKGKLLKLRPDTTTRNLPCKCKTLWAGEPCEYRCA